MRLSMSRCRFLLVVFEVRMWRLKARLLLIFPVADIRKRLAAPLLVFILGMAISLVAARCGLSFARGRRRRHGGRAAPLLRRQDHVEERALLPRSEEHTSELQSRFDLVCRPLLEKKKQ